MRLERLVVRKDAHWPQVGFERQKQTRKGGHVENRIDGSIGTSFTNVNVLSVRTRHRTV